MSPSACPVAGLRELDLRTLSAPDAAALVRPGQSSFSFLQCAAAADRIALELQKAGIRRGDLVALAIPNAEQLLLGFLGAARVAAAAPLDYKLAEPALQSRMLLLKPSALVTTVEPDPKLMRTASATGTPLLGLSFPPGHEDRPEIVSMRPCTPAARTNRNVSADVAAVFQTSATTGTPKLAPLTHRNLAAMIGNVQRSFGLRADDRFLCLMPLYHLAGLLSCLAQLLSGGVVICSNAFDPAQFMEWLETDRPTWYLAGPAIHRAILQLVQERPGRFSQSTLRFIRSGTAAIPPFLVEALERSLRVPVIHGYGMTEAGVITSTFFNARHAGGSVGKSIGVAVGIMAPDGSLLPSTVQGEIVLRGEEVISGYLDDPDANRAAFHNGWFRTGDLGWLDPDGELFITGRLREIINRGGEKILPHEIDSVLAEHPAVEQAAAFAIPHPALGEDIATAVILRPGAAADESELRSYMAPRVGQARLPSRIFFVDEIPVSATGKPRRRELSQVFARATEFPSPGKSQHSNTATNPMEQRIAEIWVRVLGIPAQPHENESFFALGGDSLALTQMLAIMEAEMGVDARLLASPRFLAAPTIATLREAIVENRTNGNLPLASPRVDAVVLQEHGKRPPFFCFPGATLDASYFRPLARLAGDGQPFVVLRDTTWDTGANALAFEDLIHRFVEYIRDTQRPPLGPIGGHCFGGIVAFECACRLEALGWPVPAVVLFDTAAPGYPKPSRHWIQYLKWAPQTFFTLRRGTALAAGREVIAHLRYLSNRSAKSGSTGQSGPESACEEERRIASVADAAAAIMRSYVPRPFGGCVVHFMAADKPVTTRVLEDARLGWRDFARGGFESHLVRGGHDSMFSEEFVAQLAHLLRDVLRVSRPAE
jgi:oxalate---CoA ligase